MNIPFIRRLFAPKLRNRPQGMAWIRGIDHGNGTAVLNGRAVRTIRIQEGARWFIDPPQRITFTRDTLYTGQNILALAGESLTITAIADDCLEPWKEDGVSQDEVRELFAPEGKVAA